jgi:hypothetical protein
LVAGELLAAMPAVQAAASHLQPVVRVVAESVATVHPPGLHLCLEKVHSMRLLALCLWRLGAGTTIGADGGSG